jgi:single-stranded-DNA-specific exonuclease
MRRWRISTPNPAVASKIALELKIHPLLGQILANRGIETSAEAKAFLDPSLLDLHSPLLLKDMEEAISRLKVALARQERILLYGDYDVDGITGVALFWYLLRELKGKVSTCFPDRVREGYGMKEEAIRRAKEEGVGLIIAVDQGITAHREEELARELGMEMIICDHHVAGEKIPGARAVLNPLRLDCPYPFKSLAAAGVAFKVCQALAEKMGLSSYMDQHLDLVALGTIADVVPLRGENRIFARHGLKQLPKSEKAGIRALLEATGLSESEPTAGQVAFILGPRLNAAGRVKEADLAFQLLTTPSSSEAARLARLLEELNRERQAMEKAAVEEVSGMAGPGGGLPKAICLCSERWHVGVIGIVASRLVDTYHRPAAIIALRGERGRGSARSIPGFPINRVLEKCSHLLEGFGGHPLAAGFSIQREKVPAFAERFQAEAAVLLSEEDFVPELAIDGEVSLGEVSWRLASELKMLEPYGLGNPEPVLAAHGLQVMQYPRRVGNDHLKIKVRDQGKVVDAIGFGMGNILEELLELRGRIDLAFCLGINTYRGYQDLQLRIKDLVRLPS